MRLLMLSLMLLTTAARAQVPPNPGQPRNGSFLEDFAQAARYAKAQGLIVACESRPCMMRGDFDGDGKRDFALQVQDKAKQRPGVAVLLARGTTFLLGAGAVSSPMGSDWTATPRIRVVAKSTMVTPPLGAKGDLIAVSAKVGSPESMVFFDGSRFAVSQ